MLEGKERTMDVIKGYVKSMGDRMKEANGLIGMVKYAAERSGSKYVIGREGWKTMIVSQLMYGCGALAWYQRECDDLEVIQNGFGRWLWEVGNVRNELVRGESGWSSFAEREVKCIVDWLLRIVYEESLVSDIGRACRACLIGFPDNHVEVPGYQHLSR